MPKKKRGRGRGRGPGPYYGGGGGGGGGGGAGGQNRGRGRRPPRMSGSQRPPQAEPETLENGEPVPLEPASGILELHPNGYGFLRDPNNNYMRERTDPFVPGTMIEKFRLREGLMLHGMVQQSRKQQGPRLREIL